MSDMKKVETFGRVALLIGLASILLVSCVPPVQTEPNQDQGTGQLSISLPALAPWLQATKDAASAAPARAFLRITSVRVSIRDLTDTNDIIAPVSASLESASASKIISLISGIPPGSNYRVKIDIYNSAVGSSPVLSALKTGVSITGGAVASLSFTPLPLAPTTLSLGTPAGTSLILNGEAWYKITLTGGTYYSISLSAATQKEAYIFDPTGHYEWASVSPGESIVYFPQTTGDYYIGAANLNTGGGDDSFTLSATATAGPKAVDYVTQTGTVHYGLTGLPVGSDVYFVFTNTNASSATKPTVTPSSNMGGQWLESERSQSLPSHMPGERGTAEISAQNTEISRSITASVPSASVKSRANFLRQNYAVGASSKNWDTDGTTGTPGIPVTLRAETAAVPTLQGDRVLRIWVANNCWTSGGTKAHLVTQTMVDVLVDRFLKAGASNDIYDWVTSIFGAEWGPTGYTNLIAFDGSIDIVLLDIDEDNSTNGGVLGYFWGKDNLVVSYLPASNQAIAFVLDAVLFANNDDDGYTGGSSDTWDPASDYWPKELISTLAHEFQHMIGFYQNIEDTPGTETWLDELLSMATEDVVADKLGVPGPRGVDADDYTAGSANNTDGRLPLFNYYNDDTLTTWLTGGDVYRSYSTSYAFGAYLLRNYGGPAVLKAVYNSTGSSTNAIVDAVRAVTGESAITFNDIMRRWGAAVLLSDQTNAPTKVRYNNGGMLSFFYNENTYNLGSINLFNYAQYLSPGIDTTPGTGDDVYQIGPYMGVNGVLSEGANLKALSNTYYRASLDISGSKNYTVTLPEGVLMTVVVKQ